MRHLYGFLPKNYKKPTLIDSFISTGQKLPVEIFIEGSLPGTHFVVTQIEVPRDDHQNIIREKVVVIGDVYKWCKITHKDVHIPFSFWHMTDWKLYVSPISVELKKHFTDDGYFQYYPNECEWVGWSRVTKDLLVVKFKDNEYIEFPQMLYYKYDRLRDHIKRYRGSSDDIDSSIIVVDKNVLSLRDFTNRVGMTNRTKEFLYRAVSLILYESDKMNTLSSTRRW
jgi:hypothetical protein